MVESKLEHGGLKSLIKLFASSVRFITLTTCQGPEVLWKIESRLLVFVVSFVFKARRVTNLNLFLEESACLKNNKWLCIYIFPGLSYAVQLLCRILMKVIKGFRRNLTAVLLLKLDSVNRCSQFSKKFRVACRGIYFFICEYLACLKKTYICFFAKLWANEQKSVIKRQPPTFSFLSFRQLPCHLRLFNSQQTKQNNISKIKFIVSWTISTTRKTLHQIVTTEISLAHGWTRNDHKSTNSLHLAGLLRSTI